MIEDENRIYSLTKFSGRTGNKSIKNSDHNTLIMELDISWSSNPKETEERIEIFNFNNQEEFAKFIELSNENYVLKNLFNNDDEDMDVSAKKWLRTVNRIIS